MWKFDTINNKWVYTTDSISTTNFDYLKQSLESVNLYSKYLSSATYYPVNDLNNIYDILQSRTPMNWVVPGNVFPNEFPRVISPSTSNEYYNKFLPEYGLSLKNKFTPNRIIDDAFNNFTYVDVATTYDPSISGSSSNVSLQNIGALSTGLIIDGVTLKEGHRVLVKDQVTYVTLLNSIDPKTYFKSNYYIDPNNPVSSVETRYYYFNEINGIYIYTNNKLVRATDLNDYSDCIRYSVYVKLGDVNSDSQFHLSRLLNGYFPNVTENDPIEFLPKHNWILRNQLDYNNVLDWNYYDVLMHDSQQYYDIITFATYSIPSRLIGVGEFGGIINFQDGVSHIITNKYKANLRSVCEVSGYYWTCGDNGTVLRVSKVDFSIQDFNLDTIGVLRSIDFFDDLRGIVVGEYNSIFYTSDGGKTWNQISISEFQDHDYNKVIYSKIDKFFVGGSTGTFIEFNLNLGQWIATKKRVSKYLNLNDEYLLVEDINNMVSFTSSSWGLSFSYGTQSIQSDKEGIMLVTNNNNIIIYDTNGFTSNIDANVELNTRFLYLQYNDNYGDLNSVTYVPSANEFYIAAANGIYSFNINNFNIISSPVSNVISGPTGPTSSNLEYPLFVNNIVNYDDNLLLVAGNFGFLDFATYSNIGNMNGILDPTFDDRFKSKLLMLDYDMASKLNFFDSNQNYVLPNSLTFSRSSFSVGSYINISTLPNETNWITYWQDRTKTFRYCSNMTDNDVVKTSTNFYYNSSVNSIVYNASQITTNLSDIIKLAPNINEYGVSRFIGGSVSISAPTSIHNIYLYEYLMVVGTQSNMFRIGDVVNFESNIVGGNFTVNNILTFGNNSYYYIYTDFNQNIINDLSSSTQSITITNLNRYKDVNTFVNNFNQHPISGGYQSFTSSVNNNIIAKIEPVFDRLSAYYNLGASVNFSGTTYSMTYENNFLLFGFTPTYDLLSYLGNINSSLFEPTKVFASMPTYIGLPGPDYYPYFSGLTSSNVYLDTNLGDISGPYFNPNFIPTNKLTFGDSLILQWESLLKNTYVDLVLTDDSGNKFNSTKLLIINKYTTTNYNGMIGYVVEFHKAITYNTGSNIKTIDILSRNTLSQISSDLQELNNIQRPNSRITQVSSFTYSLLSVTFSNYESELNFKFPTDSYAKILLSDNDIFTNISGLVYIDDKNELSLNITQLNKDIKIPIISTIGFIPPGGTYSNLFIFCSQKHGLSIGDGVFMEFNGGTGSSQTENPQYYGYHTVYGIADEYSFWVYTPFGYPSIVGGDPGILTYIKSDPFLNYQPVNLIDLGADMVSKMPVNLTPYNNQLNGYTYSLVNYDLTNYKYQLYNGLTLDMINSSYPWLMEAEVSKALIGLDSNQNLVWYGGTWSSGRWFGTNATWVSGTWITGDWYGGNWMSNGVTNKITSIDVQNINNESNSVWYGGRWFDGTWNNGTWYNGRWYGGTWSNGQWFNGTWNNGTWVDGSFIGGIWVNGTWNNGTFSCDNAPSYWLNGNWYGGDFDNGIWYNGNWDQRNGKISRFGVNSFNTRTSQWYGGKWYNGQFYSNTNISNNVSVSHKLSGWMTGDWYGGDFYGGVAFNINFQGGTWHGGILEDIEVVGIDTTNNVFVLNGNFQFNDGDTFTIIDNNIGGAFSNYGSNNNPIVYKVLNIYLDSNNFTNVYVDTDLSVGGTYAYGYSSLVNPYFTGYNLNLRVVSNFNNVVWKSGVWSNGVFNNGYFQGGIWYNGVFNSGSWI